MEWIVGVGVFLVLLFVFPRAMGGLIVLCGLVIGGFLLWTKLESDSRAREREAVSITATYDIARCSPEYPLLISIGNGSSKTIEAISFGIEGHRTGYSAPLYDSGYAGYSSDRIITRGSSWVTCWSLPRQVYGVSEQSVDLNPPNTLIWSAKNQSPRFR
jgi:hypothetical protein